jgi:RHS repeat-associated protein
MGSLVQSSEDASGLMYRRNRYYDPKTGRFTQEDPIGLAGGLNTYGFADGDPVSYTDPYGLCPERRRDASGLCPGGLSVREWRTVTATTSNMTRGAAAQTLGLLNRGNIRGASLPAGVYGQVTAREPGVVYINRTAVLKDWTGSVFDNERELGKTLAHEITHVDQLKGKAAGQEAGAYINANLDALELAGMAAESNYIVPPAGKPVCRRGACSEP